MNRAERVVESMIVEPLEWVREQGIVLQSARGPAPNLAEYVAGEPIRAAATATPDLTSPCSPTTAAGTLHTKLEPVPGGDLIGAQLARQRPGLCSIDCVYGRGRFYNLGPRRHRDRLRGQHLDAPRLIRQWRALLLLVPSRGDRSASRAAWPAARVTLSGPDVLVELAQLYSNLLPGPETLAELRDRASARLRPANHAPVRQVQQARPRTHRRADRCISTWGHRCRPRCSIPDPSHNRRVTPAAKNRLKELGVSEGAFSLPSLTRLSREWSRRMPDAWSRTCPSGAI
jgi:hypothetical protein